MAERSDVRGRMDKSLDEIAAEMHSSSREFFGRDYEARELAMDSHRDHHPSHRYSPYSSDWRSERNRERERDRDRERDGDRDGIEGRIGSRIFVANLSYSVSWQKLKDHMKQGTAPFYELFCSLRKKKRIWLVSMESTFRTSAYYSVCAFVTGLRLIFYAVVA